MPDMDEAVCSFLQFLFDEMKSDNINGADVNTGADVLYPNDTIPDTMQRELDGLYPAKMCNQAYISFKK